MTGVRDVEAAHAFSSPNAKPVDRRQHAISGVNVDQMATRKRYGIGVVKHPENGPGEDGNAYSYVHNGNLPGEVASPNSVRCSRPLCQRSHS
jgi:hypothetical protein